jgi:hypothetical protein
VHSEEASAEEGGRRRRRGRRAEEDRRGDGDADPPAAPFFAMVDAASASAAAAAAERGAPLPGWGTPAPSSGRYRDEEGPPITERISEDAIVLVRGEEDPRGREERDRYVREIWNGVHEKAIERTRLRMSLRNGGVVGNGDAARGGRGVVVDVDGANGASDEDIDDGEYVGSDDGEYAGSDDGGDVAASLRAVDDAVASVPTEEGGPDSSRYSGSGGAAVVERGGTRRRGFVRRVRRKRRRSFLVVALTVVVGRRLMLAYFGNALRLI